VNPFSDISVARTIDAAKLLRPKITVAAPITA